MLKNFIFPKEIYLIFISILLFAIALGIDLVCFPTILSLHGINSFEIGLAASFEIIGGITASFFLSRFVAKLGIIKALKFSAFSYAICISCIYFYQNLLIWFCFIFFMGFLWFLYVITRQSWLNILANNEQRGIVTGIFSMCVAAGLALGPVIVKFSGAQNYISFLISASFVVLSYLVISRIADVSNLEISSQKIPLKEFFQKNPRCFITRFFLDFQTYILLIFSVIFGTRIGLSYEAAGLLLTAFMVTGFFDLWVGFALKKISPYKMINIGFLGCIYSFIIITLYPKSYFLLLSLYFLFGLSIACIYVSVFKIANEDYEKHELIAANSTFQIIGSAGALCGGLFGGLFINLFGAIGFPISIILSNVLYLTFLVCYEKKYSKA